MKCSICEAELEDEVFYGDEGTSYEGKPLCEACYYESEACAVVYYGDSDEPHVISETRNETDGEFTVKWVSVDPWRGYYKAESNIYTKIYDDCILAGSYDARELKRFNDELVEILRKLEVRYVRVFARSSNVFSQGYEVWVHRDDLTDDKRLVLNAAIGVLAIKYRDPLRFKVTALTGKTDPSEFTEEDYQLAEILEKILVGKKEGEKHGVEEDKRAH